MTPSIFCCEYALSSTSVLPHHAVMNSQTRKPLNIVYRQTTDLVENPNNARIHPPQQMRRSNPHYAFYAFPIERSFTWPRSPGSGQSPEERLTHEARFTASARTRSIGKIRHRDAVYEGEHKGISSRATLAQGSGTAQS